MAAKNTVTQKGGGSDVLRVRPLAQTTPEHVNRMIRELNGVLGRIDERLRNTGNLKLTGDLDLNGFQIKNTGTPEADSNVVTLETLRDAIANLATDELGNITSEEEGPGGGIGGGGFVDDPTSEGTDPDGGAGGGGGGGTGLDVDVRMKEVEVDFGSIPTRVKTFSVTDPDAVATATRVVMCQNAEAATGRSADENEMDRFALATRWTAINTFEFLATAVDGPVVGLYKFSYIVGGS